MNPFQLNTPGLVSTACLRRNANEQSFLLCSSERNTITMERAQHKPSQPMPWQPRGCNPSIRWGSPNVWKSPQRP